MPRLPAAGQAVGGRRGAPSVADEAGAVLGPMAEAGSAPEQEPVIITDIVGETPAGPKVIAEGARPRARRDGPPRATPFRPKVRRVTPCGIARRLTIKVRGPPVTDKAAPVDRVADTRASSGTVATAREKVADASPVRVVREKEPGLGPGVPAIKPVHGPGSQKAVAGLVVPERVVTALRAPAPTQMPVPDAVRFGADGPVEPRET